MDAKKLALDRRRNRLAENCDWVRGTEGPCFHCGCWGHSESQHGAANPVLPPPLPADSYPPVEILTQPIDSPRLPVPSHLRAVRLKSLTSLIEEEQEWFSERPHATMYDVCPELLIPRTTCRERVVRLVPGDVDHLAAVFQSPNNLALKSSVQVGSPPVRLQASSGGLTLQSVLSAEGQLRRQYWSSATRTGLWRTSAVHGRRVEEEEQQRQLLQDLVAEFGTAGFGEVAISDLENLRQLGPGSIVVFRHGVSYAELFGETPLDSFVSHWWGEPTLDFHRALRQHAHVEGAGRHGDDHAYWICTFANSQHHVDLGTHWRQSPFFEAMEHKCCKEVVMVVDKDATPFTRIWCIFELFRCTVLRLRLEIYCRQGLVSSALHDPEGEQPGMSRSLQPPSGMWYLSTLCAKIAELDLRKAVASREEDRRMIYNAIWRESSFEEVSFKVKRLFLDYKTCMGALQMVYDPLTGEPMDLLSCKGLRVARCEPSWRNCSPCRRRLPRHEVREFYDTIKACRRSGRFVVEGPPGSGKTVLLKQLMKLACEDEAWQGIPWRLPCGELARVLSQEDASHTALERWAKQHYSSFADSVIEDHRPLLLLLDGLDETGRQMVDVLLWLEALLTDRETQQQQHDAATVCILTCRPSLRGQGLEWLTKHHFVVYKMSKMRKEDLQEMYETEVTTGRRRDKLLSTMGSLAGMQQSSLWERPLMAMMLRQYLLEKYAPANNHSTSGRSAGSIVAPTAVQEIDILEFAVDALFNQGAGAVEGLQQRDVREVFLRLALRNQKAYGTRFLDTAQVFASDVRMPPELWEATKRGRLVLVDTADRTPQFVHAVFQEYMAAVQSLSTRDFQWFGWGLVAFHQRAVGQHIARILAKAPVGSELFIGGRDAGRLGMIITAAANVRALHALLRSDAVRQQPLRDPQIVQFLFGYFFNPFCWDPRLPLVAGRMVGLRAWLGMVLTCVCWPPVMCIAWFWPVLLGICFSAFDVPEGDSSAPLPIAIMAMLCLELPWFLFMVVERRRVVSAMVGGKPLHVHWFFRCFIPTMHVQWFVARRVAILLLGDPDCFPDVDLRTPEGAAALIGLDTGMLKFPVLVVLVVLVAPGSWLLRACKRLCRCSGMPAGEAES